MKTIRTPKLLLLLTSASLLVMTPRTHAQIGSGWTQYTPSKQQSISGATAYYNNSGGVETFRISDGDKRSEMQLNPHWSNSHQFEGYVNCLAGSGDTGGASIQQIMHDDVPDQDVNQVRIYNTSGGTLKVLQGSTLGSGVYGTYVRINVIYYASTHSMETWLNGSKKSTVTAPDSGTFYFKYGIYIRPGQTQWKSIRTWQK
jgi:hypothetical protein